ncbi:uncharacterized protein SOCE26_052730 [Sorangium cellulosum]|uniref:Uncharacterized protein n=1 Tax=Sorangium cellulosum TaxID=56 RepID=A0A2L0EWZ4_SORCE|nr:hypothetical protein [Sorangium cellulosum]AUX43818.1 uncharacterized protein SOCE26_052730 [Sorangium cellulosum]
MRPIVNIPSDPLCIAEVLAALCRADIRAGVAVPLDGLVYREEERDTWEDPKELRRKGSGDCDAIVRAELGHAGAAVGCVRSGPRSFHVFVFDEWGEVDDVCVRRGMPRPDKAVYEGAAVAVVRPHVWRRARAWQKLSELVRSRATEVQRGQLTAQLRTVALQHTQDWPDLKARAEALYPWTRGRLPAVAAAADAMRVAGPEEAGDAHEDPGVTAPAPDGAEVSGFWGDVTRAVGVVAAGVVSIAATPAAGAVVVAASNAAGNIVDQVTKRDTPKPHPKDKTRKETTGVHQAAVEIARKPDATPEEKKAAAAVAAVTSPDPAVQAKVRARIKLPIGQDPNLADRTSLLAAYAGLQAAGYRPPLEVDRAGPAPARPAGGQQPCKPRVIVVQPEDVIWEEADVAGFTRELEALSLRAGCPGSCALR